MSRGLGLGYLPIAFITCFLTGLFISYGLAVHFGSIKAVWPYISDTGVALPNTCVFSLFFNISAFLSLSIMVVRYLYVKNAIRDSNPKLRRVATINMGIGCISVLGFLFVANFPEYITGPIHTVSAIEMFVTGLIYCFIDCHVTHQLAQALMWNGHSFYRLRVLISIATLVCLVMTFVAEIIAWIQWEATHKPEGASWMIYEEWYPGYTAHLVSTISEWIMAGFFLSYFLTFIHEFRRFSLDISVILHSGTVTQAVRKPVQKATENTHLVQARSTWVPTTEEQHR